MTTIISKRHKQNFYLAIILIFVAMAGIGTGLLVGFLSHLQSGKPEQYFIPVFSAVLYFTAIYAVYKYYKDFPIIQLDKNFISFNKETIALADLTHIEFTGKQYFPMGNRMEAATLTFKDGQTKYIFDDMYENSGELKSFLKQVVINKKEFVAQEIQSIDAPNLDTEIHEVYNGSQITSFNGIVLWGMIGFCVFMLLTGKKNSIELITFFLLFCLVWFFLFSWLMHYFKVSQDYFIVKNQNLFWKTKAYRIADIEEIVFETRQKMPNCLRVITKDFKSKLYPAGTLRKKTWLEMKDKLESLGLTVRNECI